ncbi:hypothetical protein SASPL_105682 [Salvia splendens]|uniref:DUF4378 domain-containing protein n=1 Tax=Salvia splendens TaxID=180675 RepID=A0A8X8YKE8_SALSN|nr:uncharacterized protein LOC121792272 [Salvia splendens]KAG6434061.1 hypothetical protein SASPL_105682 [Salvia splendens]
MERARHRKTKSASGIEGFWPIQKQKTVPRLSSDSRSYIDGSNRDDKLMLELGQSTLGRATGIPMKKLLAEEMSKDVELKRRSTNVVAKLMGLEGLPSPRHVHRQQKKFPENYQQKNIDIPINNQRSSQHYDSRSKWRSPIDQQEFKNVYEDLEASHVVDRQCASRRRANSFLKKPEMELIQQKFMDAKRLSTDEKFLCSKELNDALEMLDSNKDLLLKFLGQSDSSFTEHLHDLQVDPGNSLGSRIAVLKPSNSEKFESKAKAWRSEKDNSNKPHAASHLKRQDGLLLEPHSRHRVCSSSGITVKEMKDENTNPTRIVVLKPNLGKVQNAGTSLSSQDLSHSYQPGFKKMKEYSNVSNAKTVSWRRKNLSHNARLSKSMSNEAREIAREITMRMIDGYGETTDAKSIANRGYVGDESSYDANESDSDSESEVFRFASRRSFDGSSVCRYPSSHLGESPVNTEAKKRLSERWKKAHIYQDLEMISRGSTLGEMLALPSKETRHCQLNVKTNPGQASKELSSNGPATLDVPLGIRRRDGRKDEMCRNSSRSRSLPPPTSGRGRSHRRSPNHNNLVEEKSPVHSDSVHRSRSKVVKGNPSRRENYSARDSKSRIKKFHPRQHIFSNEIDSSPRASFEIQMEPNTKDLSEQQPMFPIVEETDNYEVPVVDVMMISDPGSTAMSSKSSELLSEQSLSSLAGDRAVDNNQEGSCLQELHKELPNQGSPHLQCLRAEPDSSECSKEADHPSPVSVLEAPCSEETPSSESFERVSAELHELRMQLKLLKLESGTYPEICETSALVPIEEEEAQLLRVVSEGDPVLAADNWRTCYAVDVLIDSGLEESYFHMSRTLWHSSNSPLDPKLFDKLEKKYNNAKTARLRWERRLLFDKINSAVVEIFHERVNLCPWVMPKVSGSNLQWQGVQDDLERLINQEYGSGYRELDREMLWSESRGEIEILGNEIERLLMDEMITEVICN